MDSRGPIGFRRVRDSSPIVGEAVFIVEIARRLGLDKLPIHMG